MSRVSHPVWATMMSLLLAMSLTSILAAKSQQSNPAQSSAASSQDKAKACNDAADKKGLKDQERKTFMQNCLSKAADAGSGGNVSEQDKAKTCNNLADKNKPKGCGSSVVCEGLYEKSQPPIG